MTGAVYLGDKIFINPQTSLMHGTMQANAAILGAHSPIDRLAILIIHELLHVSGDFLQEAGRFENGESTGNGFIVEQA
jgi:hypothetical protein